MTTSVKVSRKQLVKKLEQRLKTLLHRHEIAKSLHKETFEDWKKEIQEWVRANASTNASRIAVSNTVSDRYNYRISKDWHEVIMAGAPTPPKKPKRPEAIRNVQDKLRLLSMSSEALVHVTSHEANEWFDDVEIGAED